MRRSFPSLLWTGSGVLLILAGIISFLRPDAILNAVAVLFGVVLFILGIYDLTIYFGMRGVLGGSGWLLINGASTLLLSVLLLFRSDSVVRALPLLLGGWLLISGISRSAHALRLRRIGNDDWGWMCGCGSLLALCGLLFLFAPFVGLTAIGAVMGFALFLVGAVILLSAYLAGRFWF